MIYYNGLQYTHDCNLNSFSIAFFLHVSQNIHLNERADVKHRIHNNNSNNKTTETTATIEMRINVELITNN